MTREQLETGTNLQETIEDLERIIDSYEDMPNAILNKNMYEVLWS